MDVFSGKSQKSHNIRKFNVFLQDKFLDLSVPILSVSLLAVLRKVKVEVNCMPHHEAKKMNNQQNKSRMKEETVSLNERRAKQFPPTLNNVPKQES